MHYGAYYFSINGERTIITKNEKYQNLIGNRATLTAKDMSYVDILYSYSDDDVDFSQCKCENFDLSGFQYHISRNGHYKTMKTDSTERLEISITGNLLSNYFSRDLKKFCIILLKSK